MMFAALEWVSRRLGTISSGRRVARIVLQVVCLKAVIVEEVRIAG